nr:PREDICTED: type-1 protein phosphatase inhibitor 4-like [Rhinolophus sinicus]
MAAFTTSHRPIRGILKNKSSTTASSVEAPTQQSGGATQVQRKKSQRWDESNILATYRPSYRDYDLMKINEPSTPQLSIQDGREDTAYGFETKDRTQNITVDILAKKFAAIDTSELNRKMREPESLGAHTSKIFLDKQEKQRQFELRRKLHYNEGLTIKLARQLIARDFQFEEMEDENKQCPLLIFNEEKTPAEEPDEDPASDELQNQPRYV